jgi:hypothetical protein
MTLGIDECWFPDRSALTAFSYGCRCSRCKPFRKRYDGQRPNKPRRRVSRKEALRATPAPTTPRQRAVNPHNQLPYNGPCRCMEPKPEPLGIFAGRQCGACGMPIPTERTDDGTTA